MIWLIVVGAVITIVIGVSIWFLQPAKVKPEEPFSREEYEPDYPVKELLELIIRDGYERYTGGTGAGYRFLLDGKQQSVYRELIPYVYEIYYTSSIEWLKEEESKWLLQEINQHFKHKKEDELNKQREEAGEWIKQELGATDDAKRVLWHIKQGYLTLVADKYMQLNSREIAWIHSQLSKHTTV